MSLLSLQSELMTVLSLGVSIRERRKAVIGKTEALKDAPVYFETAFDAVYSSVVEALCGEESSSDSQQYCSLFADEQIARFNVRGEVVSASREMLLRQEGTYFHGLLSSGLWAADCMGEQASSSSYVTLTHLI